ncbi:MAG TPA: lysylphosphatidylglycerol synthase transmembrane domain-containing protein [Gemmatirosa sp.]
MSAGVAAGAARRRRLSPRARVALSVGAWLAGTALVVVALRAVGWEAALAAVRRAHPLWLVVAVCCHGSIVFLWAWQTYVLLPRGPDGRAALAADGTRVTYARCAEVQALTATASNTVPAFLGQATGVALLSERVGIGTAGALSVFAQHNLVEGFAKIGVLFAAAQVAPLPHWMREALVALAVGIVVLTAALGTAAWYARRHTARAADAALAPAPAVPNIPADADRRRRDPLARARAFIVSWAATLDALRHPGQLAAAFAIAAAMKLAEASGWWAIEHAFDVAPRRGSAILALAATNLASAIPASPGNLGVYEGAAFSAYHVLLGVPRETAIALALLGHVCYLIPLVGIGWAILSVRQVSAFRARRPGGAPDRRAAP